MPTSSVLRCNLEYLSALFDLISSINDRKNHTFANWLSTQTVWMVQYCHRLDGTLVTPRQTPLLFGPPTLNHKTRGHLERVERRRQQQQQVRQTFLSLRCRSSAKGGQSCLRMYTRAPARSQTSDDADGSHQNVLSLLIEFWPDLSSRVRSVGTRYQRPWHGGDFPVPENHSDLISVQIAGRISNQDGVKFEGEPFRSGLFYWG